MPPRQADNALPRPGDGAGVDAVLARAVALRHPDAVSVQEDGQVIVPLHGDGHLLCKAVQLHGLYHLPPVDNGGSQRTGPGHTTPP